MNSDDALVKRRPMVAGLIAAVVLVALVGLAAFGWSFSQTALERAIAQEERENAKRQAIIASQERALARTAEAAAKEQRDLAEIQKARAEKQLLRAESLLYISHFTEAHNHFLNHDLVKCRLALDECRWDLRGLEYGYLVKQMEKKGRTLFGHTKDVSSLALSGDGKRLVSGSGDKTIKVWDVEAGKETLTLRGHTDGVTSLALSPDGKRLFSASKDGTIKVWDTATGKEIATLRDHTGGVTCLALDRDGERLFSGSQDQTIKVWRLRDWLPR